VHAQREVRSRYETHSRELKVIRSKFVVQRNRQVLFDSDFKERTYGLGDRIITGGGGAVVGGVTTESVGDDHQPWWALKLNIVSPIAVIPTSTVRECRAS